MQVWNHTVHIESAVRQCYREVEYMQVWNHTRKHSTDWVTSTSLYYTGQVVCVTFVFYLLEHDFWVSCIEVLFWAVLGSKPTRTRTQNREKQRRCLRCINKLLVFMLEDLFCHALAHICNLKAWYIRNSWDSYGHNLCSAHSGFIFMLLWEGFPIWKALLYIHV